MFWQLYIIEHTVAIYTLIWYTIYGNKDVKDIYLRFIKK